MKLPWTPILCYHRVCPKEDFGVDSHSICVTPGQFQRQMALLKWLGFRTISLQDLVAFLKLQKNIPSRSVVLTFDDGYQDNYTYAYPILKKHRFTATVFLVTGHIGNKNSWDSGTVSLLNREQIEEMQSGGINFGSHSSSHLDMSQADAEAIRTDIGKSRTEIESIGARTDIPFCYPYSKLNDEVKKWVKEASYLCATAVDQGPYEQSLDLFEMRRIQVFPSTSLFGFWKKLQSWYPAWLRIQQKVKNQTHYTRR